MDAEKIFQEFKITDATQAKALHEFLKANAKTCADAGIPLHVIVTNEEIDRFDEQVMYYFGIFIKALREQVWPAGKQYSREAWHEYLSTKFLPCKEVELPSGEITFVRASIARGKIGMKAMAAYTRECEAWATSEYGVILPENPYQR